MQTHVHLHFKGNCREAFDFYADTLGGRIVFAMTYGEAPGMASAPETRNQIVHARVDLGEQFRRFGMCTDRFGIPWMVNCARPQYAAAGEPRRTA